MAYSLRLERTVDGNMAQDAEMLFHPRRNPGFDWPGDFAGVMDLLQQEVTLGSADTNVRGIRREREKSYPWQEKNYSIDEMVHSWLGIRLSVVEENVPMWNEITPGTELFDNHNTFNHLKR
jgi:hypothetical protein